MKRLVSSCPVGNLRRTRAGSFRHDFLVVLQPPLAHEARLQARCYAEGLQEDLVVLRAMAEDCWVEGCHLGKGHCKAGKEAAIVLMEGAVLCLDLNQVQVSPPCCCLVHSQVLLCLSHAQDCPHLSPNRLSPTLPLQHLQTSSVSSWTR